MSTETNSDLYAMKVRNARGENISLDQYKGKTLLIVNVASGCGFTPQYEGLQKLYEQYQAQGLEILGFPCNQFGGQESGSNEEIQTFCTGRFGVRFPVLGKIDVNGENAAPIFQFLKKAAPGILGTEKIKWNFTKFLVSKEGKVLQRFAPIDKPESMAEVIEKALEGNGGLPG
jgi:glutathione peroxidase